MYLSEGWAMFAELGGQVLASVWAKPSQPATQPGPPQLFTDRLAIFNHQRILEGLSGITRSVNSSELENNIYKLWNTMSLGERDIFEQEFKLRVMQTGEGISIASLCISDTFLARFEFAGNLTLNDRIFKKSHQGDECDFQLISLEEISPCFQLLLARVVNPQNEEVNQRDAKIQFFNTLHVDSLEASPVAVALVDLRRAINHLPVIASTGDIITAEKYASRTRKLLADLISDSSITVTNENNRCKFVFNGCPQKFVASFEKIFWSESLTDEDRAFLLVLNNQAFKTPINSSAAHLVTASVPKPNPYDLQNMDAMTKLVVNSEQGEGDYFFQILQSENSNDIKIQVSTTFNFRECEFFKEQPVTGSPVVAHQDVVAIYTLSFDVSQKKMNATVDFARMNWVLHDKEGNLPVTYKISDVTVHPGLK